MFVFYDYVCEGMTIAMMKCRERSTNTAYELTFNVDGKVSKYYCEKVITVAESLSRRCGEEIKKIIIVADDIDYSTYKYIQKMDITFEFSDKYALGLELYFYCCGEIRPIFVDVYGFAERFIFDLDILACGVDSMPTMPAYYMDEDELSLEDKTIAFYARNSVPVDPLPAHVQKALNEYVVSKSLGEIKKDYYWRMYEDTDGAWVYEPY